MPKKLKSECAKDQITCMRGHKEYVKREARKRNLFIWEVMDEMVKIHESAKKTVRCKSRQDTNDETPPRFF